MKRKTYNLKAGAISNLKIVESELSEPASDEVTIQVKTIGFNFADLFAIWGLYGATPEGEFTPGLEYAGDVIKVGSAVTDVKVGQKIMGLTRFGGYASHLNIDHRYVTPLPEGWSYQEGASFLVQVFTAYYGLINLGNIQQGNTVLIHSAAGGVGLQANRIAKKFGAYTIGTVGRPDKVAFLNKNEDYDHVIVRGSDFKAQLTKALGDRDLNIIMDSIGGKYFEIGFEMLAEMGRVIAFGSGRYASPNNRPNYLKMAYQFFTRPKVDPQNMVETNRSIMGFNLIWLYDRVEMMNEILVELEKMQLPKPHVGHEFAFEDLKEGMKLFQSGKTIGKVVINV